MKGKSTLAVSALCAGLVGAGLVGVAAAQQPSEKPSPLKLRPTFLRRFAGSIAGGPRPAAAFPSSA